MEELKNLYDKFCSHEYSVADISSMLSYTAVPDEMIDMVKDAEEKIEYLRFMVSGAEQESRVKKILKDLAKKEKKYRK